MISLFTESIKSFDEKIVECSQNIDEIRNLSSILNVVNIESTPDYEASYDILEEVLHYENTMVINDYSTLTCPCCKKKGTLTFHKTYERNFIFNVGKYRITSKINLIVLTCSHCKVQKDKQQYHALIPSFILPYHSFSKGIIFDSINDKIVNQEKVKDIETNYMISYQLLYYWIGIMKKYIMVCSIILKIPCDIVNIIKNIKMNENIFLYKFYQKYFHPFFLNRITCVPLAISP